MRQVVDVAMLRERLPLLRSAVDIAELSGGMSNDRVYLVTDTTNGNRLVRVAHTSERDRLGREFTILQLLQQHGVKAPRPLELGALEDVQICYVVLSYLVGDSAAQRLMTCSDGLQYTLGFEAGAELARMHELKAPTGVPGWFERRSAKHRSVMGAYRECGFRFPHDDDVCAFIESHAAAMADRPSRFLHGDFHVGNVIIHDGHYTGALDFDRWDWGDPFCDFAKGGIFSREVSVSFCLGQVDGYFGGAAVPDGFWELYTLYVGMTLFRSLLWTLRIVPEDKQHMVKVIHQVMVDHDNFQSVVPRWYRDR